jgi:hypothetical protein
MGLLSGLLGSLGSLGSGLFSSLGSLLTSLL